MIKPDSLIFDMDGTLWDNVNSYEIVWNRALEILGYDTRVTREVLIGLMGKEPRALLNTIIPGVSIENQDVLFDEVIDQYQKLVPDIKPTIYDGVYDGLEMLATKYPLFLLSNCEEGGLVNFMNHTKTTHLFKDYMEHGQNSQPKSFNLQLLQDRNNISNPVYVGDTDSDSRESHKAKVPFVFMTYGFGDTDKYQLKFDSFNDMVEHYMGL